MLEASCIQNFDLLHGDMLRFLGQPILNSKLAVCGDSPGHRPIYAIQRVCWNAVFKEDPPQNHLIKIIAGYHKF